MAPTEQQGRATDRASGSEPIGLQRVGGSRGLPPWLAVVAVAIVAVGIVGAGFVGALAGPPRPPAVSTAPPRASGSVASPPATTSAAPSLAETPAATAPAFVHDDQRLGYRVRAGEVEPEKIDIADDGRTVEFTHSRVSLAAGGFGSLTIAVGTPALGARAPVDDGDAYVYGADLNSLVANFAGVGGAALTERQSASVDGHSFRIVDRMAPHGEGVQTVALTVDRGRAFVITAAGFDAGAPARTADDRVAALLDFLGRLEFTGPGVFWSTDLGFEAPRFTDSDSDIEITAAADSPAGTVTFTTPTAEEWIRVDVGDASHPPVAPVRTPPQSNTALWAADFTTLSFAFVDAYGRGTQSSRGDVGGEEALIVDHPGDVGAAIVTAHLGRAYIITSGSHWGAESDAMRNFLSEFRFPSQDPGARAANARVEGAPFTVGADRAFVDQGQRVDSSIVYREFAAADLQLQPGTIEIWSGSPAHPALIGGKPVSAPTTGDLETVVRRIVAGIQPGGESVTVDGHVARVLARRRSTGDQRSLALLVAGGRSYVIEASGFSRVLPNSRDANRAGLGQFVRRLRFVAAEVFSDAALGFEIVAEGDVVVKRSASSPRIGTVTVTDRIRGSTATVAVGSAENPVLVTLRGPFGVPVTSATLWASTAADLQTRFEAVFGKPRSVDGGADGDRQWLVMTDSEAYGRVEFALRDGRIWAAWSDSPQGEADAIIEFILLPATAQ